MQYILIICFDINLNHQGPMSNMFKPQASRSGANVSVCTLETWWHTKPKKLTRKIMKKNKVHDLKYPVFMMLITPSAAFL